MLFVSGVDVEQGPGQLDIDCGIKWRYWWRYGKLGIVQEQGKY